MKQHYLLCFLLFCVFMATTLIRPLKILLFLILFWGICFVDLFAQVPGISQIDKLRKENALPKNRIPDLNFITSKEYTELKPPAIISNQSFLSEQSSAQRSQTGNCADSSFKKLFEALDRSYNFLCSNRTKDGGILIGFFGRNILASTPWYAIITKFDSIGNHLWSREIRSDVVASLYIESISELKDGSILVSGVHENTLSITPPTPNVDFFISKLSSTGNLIWLKTYHSLLGNSCTISNIRFPSFAEGANGDIYVAGTIYNCPLPMYLVVFKINSTGVLQWKYSFSVPEYVYGIGVFFEGNNITVINQTSESGTGVVHINLMKLNESSGAYISHKSWEIDLPNPLNFYAGFVSGSPKAIRLNNGNYCIYGPTFGDFISASTDQPHFAVLEFNGSYDYIKGYTINSSLAANPSESRIKVDRFGRAMFMLTTFSNWLNKTKYIGKADNGTIINQRKRDYTNMETFYDNFELFEDSSYVYINNMATPGQANFYLEYSLLHDSDTGSLCLGLRDNFSHTVPLQYIPYNFTWGTIDPNPLIATNNQNNSSIPIDYTGLFQCFEKHFCDTLKIHGNPASCNTQQTFTFTSFRNKECNTPVNWIIDPSVVQLFQTLNDTTIQLKFNQPWQGWLHAEIRGACGLVKDSLLITISASPGIVNIGPDTALCPGNTILLNARRGFASYKWNDGSTDSIHIVNSPGKFYVEVSDACGNFFSDTIIVSVSPPIPFYIGPDRTKCNNDTLHLAAPSGFLNYNLGLAYNINTQTAQQVIVQPAIDTIYFVKAEKTPGCFAYDTVKIKINQSPPVNLGADKSLCLGDSALLNAGIGFMQYQWSNGSTSQQIIVRTTGNYSVIGTSAQGCKSYDTLRISNIWQNPVVTLNDDPELCTGSIRALQAGNFSSYLWQDGSTASSFLATDTGTYDVTVTDNNQCKGSDTVRIVRLLPLPANFLPADTVICSYGNMQIMPINTYSKYTWSNNASSSSISITSPGIYWLQVTDAKNCVGKDSIVVNPKDCFNGFYIPTGFTPDNNGINDVFKPFISGTIKQYQFTIYNRWGQVVFTTKELRKGWDGKIGSVIQDSNVFAWLCSYQIEGEPMKIEKGTVLLIR